MSVIEVEGITKYHEGRVVLDDVTLSVDEGVNLAMIGEGGAGKSLLLKIICGLVTPERGRVSIRGVDIGSLDAKRLAEVRFDIGMLFQNYALFDFMTVAENIAFPLRQEGELDEAEITDRVERILAQIGLPGIGEQYPRELSGGMKKRVSFARAVIPEPPIVFYDDPTAGLDPVTSSKIFEMLREMQEERGVTSITITHDIEGIKEICDRFAMLDRGRLIFEGSRDEIESSEIELVRKFWQGYSDDRLG
jgi:phospholipid/cholesterol/gamma-HCH transport system ATP-binding protein